MRRNDAVRRLLASTGRVRLAVAGGAAAAALLLVVMGRWSTCSSKGPGAPQVDVRRWTVTRLPPEARAKSLVMADDGADYAYVVATPEGFAVVHGGERGPFYPEVRQPRFAPRTHRLVYWAMREAAGRAEVLLVVDGQPMPTELVQPGTVVFSADGRRWAAIGGTQTPGDGEPQRDPVVLYADGQRLGAFADASLPVFSPDGAHLAWLAEGDDGRVALLVDGREVRAYEAPQVRSSPAIKPEPVGPNLSPQFRVAYLSDGSLLVLAHDRDGWALFRGDTRLSSYRQNVAANPQGNVIFSFGDEFRAAATIAAGSLVTAAAAPVAAWWERRAGEEEGWRVVRDGEAEASACRRPWDGEPPALSADGRHLAYACHTTPPGAPDEVYVVADGRRYGPYANVWGITWSPDGSRVAYAADDGSTGTPWQYFVDGVARPLRYQRVWPPRFNPDGRHLAWVAERNGRLLLFLDGAGYASSDDIFWAPAFIDGGLNWGVIRGRRVSRVEVRGVEGSSNPSDPRTLEPSSP